MAERAGRRGDFKRQTPKAPFLGHLGGFGTLALKAFRFYYELVLSLLVALDVFAIPRRNDLLSFLGRNSPILSDLVINLG